MKPWLRALLIVIIVLAALYGAYLAWALPSNGNTVNVEVHVGTTSAGGGMYMRCANATSGAVCGGGDQMTLTVHKRDKVHVTIIDDAGPGHLHDFRITGWQYLIPPNRPETELQTASEDITFTAWATGSFHALCELPGHEAAGMQGTLVVQ